MTIHDETEAETRTNRILPALQAAGWGKVDGSRIREELICPGRITSGGKRGKSLSCDYVLMHKGHKLAVLEAKRAGVSHRNGVGQAKDYAGRLGARFAYASNGLAWYAIDMSSGAEGDIALPFPSPDELWQKTFVVPNFWRERFGAVEFETDGGKWEPRYYQHKAITAVLEAISKGDRRILLTLATGTGKTSIAFQIAWKLFQSKWNLTGEPVRRPRILFLADRNILADQAYNSFSAFPNDAITRIDPDAIRKNRGNPNYCHRVTAEDGEVGNQHLRDFQDNDKTIPTVLTTSQKLSTGVDARNVRHIVLMRPIRWMIEFKQIIGRGTRTYDGKDFFTIWDFVKAHENFNDPEWDGEPLEPEPPREPRPKPEGQDVEGDPADDHGDGGVTGEDDGPREKIVITLSDGKARAIAYLASTSYWSADGRPISAADFLQRLFGDLAKIIPDEDALREVWSDPDNREHFLGQLLDRGYDLDRLDYMRRLIDAPDSDLFDVLSYILFTHTPKSRTARAETVMTQRMDGFEGEMRELIVSILNAYAHAGESELATQKLGRYLTARYGSIGEGRVKLGNLDAIKNAYKTMQARLYID